MFGYTTNRDPRLHSERCKVVCKAVMLCERGGGQAVALNKEQKLLAVKWGLMAMSSNERARESREMVVLRAYTHPTLETPVADYPINLTLRETHDIMDGLDATEDLLDVLTKMMLPYVAAARDANFLEKLMALA